MSDKGSVFQKGVGVIHTEAYHESNQEMKEAYVNKLLEEKDKRIHLLEAECETLRKLLDKLSEKL